MKTKLLLLLLLSLAIGLFADGGISTVWSEVFQLNVDVSDVAVSGTVKVSPFAEDASEEASLWVDGTVVVEWSPENPLWNTGVFSDGLHTLTLEPENVSVEVFVHKDVCGVGFVHGGVLENDEHWTANTYHVLKSNLSIPKGKTLTIEEGTSVIFFNGAKTLLDGGGHLQKVSKSFRLDVRDKLVANGIEHVSPVAETETVNPRLLVGGTEVVGWTSDNPLWDTTNRSNGEHQLMLAGENVSAGVEVLNSPDYMVHGGVMEQDEIWEANTVHVLRHWVRIPKGRILTIADGVTLRFCENTGFLVEGTIHNNAHHVIVEDQAIVNSMFVGNTTLRSVTIAEGVTSIGEDAFNGCSSLTSITIPSSVSSLGNNAFNGCTGLTSLTLNEGLASIGANAFSGCTSLESVTIPGRVTSIGQLAFQNCTNLGMVTVQGDCGVARTNDWRGPFYGCSNLKKAVFARGVKSIAAFIFKECGLEKVTLPDTLMEIGQSAFEMTKLTSVTIPTSVTRIGDYAFGSCVGLTSITIPPSVTSIGNYAFRNCPLETVALPASLTQVGANAFEGCATIREATIPQHFAMKNLFPNSYTTIERLVVLASGQAMADSMFSGCNGLLSVIFENGVDAVSNSALSNCANLTSVIIPDGVASIGDSAFNGCSQLENVVVPDSVTSIGNSAFNGCTGLANVTLSEGLESIGQYAFSGCTSLESVVIPGSVTSIGQLAFQNCTNLGKVTIHGDCGVARTYNWRGPFYGCSNLKEAVFAEGVTTVAEFIFKECGLESVVLPDTLTDIGTSAFEMTKLTSVTIPNGVTSIGDYAFNGCTELVSVALPNSLETIGGNAFSGCKRITEATVPLLKTLASLFPNSYSMLERLCLAEGVTTVPANVKETLGLADCASLKSLGIPDSVTVIENQAFRQCSTLEYVTIGEGLESFGQGVFDNCPLKAVYCKCRRFNDLANRLLGGVPVIALPGLGWANSDNATHPVQIFDETMFAVTELTASSVELSNASLMGVSIETPEWIGLESHELEAGQSVRFSDYLQEETGIYVGGLTFRPVGSIDFSYIMPAALEELENGLSILGLWYMAAVVRYDGDGAALAIPEESVGQPVREILPSVFHGNEALTSVVLPDSVTTIGDEAFMQCTELAELVLSRNLSRIGENAFQRCAKLTSLRFPEGAVTIGPGAFSGCTRLQAIAFTGYPPVYEGTGRLFPHRSAVITAYKNDTRHWSGWKGYGWSGETFLQVTLNLVDFPVSGDYTYQVDCKDCAWLVSYNGEESTLALPEELDGHSLWGIYSYAFSTRILDKLTIPASVQKLFEHALHNGWFNKTVTFLGEEPPSVIDADMCKNSSPRLLVPDTEAWGAAIDDGWKFHSEDVSFHVGELGCRVDDEGNAVLGGYWGDGELVIPAEINGRPVAAIPDNCFANDSTITSVTIEDGVESIGASAFKNCPNLATVTIADSVTSIGDNAFRYCRGLTSVVIPDGVAFIGASAFQDCSSLASVIIGDGVTNIGNNAFRDCSNLAAVTIGNGVLDIGEGAFQNCSSLAFVVIPDCVEEIRANTFSGCTNLVSVRLPYKLVSIDESAFNYCDSIAEIHFPGTPALADTWLDFMPAVTLYVFADQGWLEELDDDGTYYGLEVVTGDDAYLGMFYDGGDLGCLGGEGEMDVISFPDWTAVSSVPWLKVITASGTGAGTLRFAFDPNPNEEPRTGSISVSLTKYGISKSIDVTQERFHYTAADFEYVLEDGKAVIINCTSEDATVVVPAILGGAPVARIDDGAFANAPQVTNLVFQGAMPVYEGDGALLSAAGATASAFRSQEDMDFGWDGVETFGGVPVSLADVPSDGDWLYALGADGATLLRYVGNGTTVVVPEEIGGQAVVEIGGVSVMKDSAMATLGAFEGCISVVKVVVPESVARVFSGFGGCAGLENLLAYGGPFVAEGPEPLLPEGAVLNAQEGLGWEEVLDEDGMFHGTAAAVHPRPLPEEIFIEEYDGVETTLDVAAVGGWTLDGAPEWLALEATTGEGAAQLAAVYAENPREGERSAELVVTLACGFEYATTLTQAARPIIRDLTVNGETTRVLLGTEVNVVAEDRLGYDFIQWTAEGIVLANPADAAQSFEMPANAVTLTAVYEIHTHTLTVDGVESVKEYGTEIEVVAEDRVGHTFTGWTAVGITLADPLAARQAFDMPDNDVTLDRNYAVNRYALTVNEVTVQQPYDTQVTVNAEDRVGYTFTRWTAVGIELADPANKAQAFQMPANDVTLTAEYAVNWHTLTVDGVAVEKAYGTMVEVTAEDRIRYEFTGWTAEGVALTDPAEKMQTFAMPDNNVTLATNYITYYVQRDVLFAKGWNLVTMTDTLDAESAGHLLALRPMVWDASRKGLAFAAADDAAPGKPLWIHCDDDTPLTLYGIPVAGWELTLQSGGNFVGAVEDVPRGQLPADASVWQWNGERCEEVEGGLEAGRAYWIQVDEE